MCMFQIVSFSKRGKYSETKFVYDYPFACEVCRKLSCATDLGYYQVVADYKGQYWFDFV